MDRIKSEICARILNCDYNLSYKKILRTSRTTLVLQNLGCPMTRLSNNEVRNKIVYHITTPFSNAI